MQAISTMTEVEMRRLSWRCRRGLLELDIVLQHFAERHLAKLNAAELAAFDCLLDYPDNEFLDVVTAKTGVEKMEFVNTSAMQQLLVKLRCSTVEQISTVEELT
mgnify:FL=1